MKIESRTPKVDSQECQYCGKPAICNSYTCYKKKDSADENDYDCSTCEERLCQQHWRIYFRRNI